LLRYATLFLPHTICFSAGLSECRFSIPAPILGGVVSLTLRKRGRRKIISHSAGHSVVTGIWAAKKADTSMCADQSQKDRIIPCGFGFTMM